MLRAPWTPGAVVRRLPGPVHGGDGGGAPALSWSPVRAGAGIQGSDVSAWTLENGWKHGRMLASQLHFSQNKTQIVTMRRALRIIWGHSLSLYIQTFSLIWQRPLLLYHLP